MAKYWCRHQNGSAYTPGIERRTSGWRHFTGEVFWQPAVIESIIESIPVTSCETKKARRPGARGSKARQTGAKEAARPYCTREVSCRFPTHCWQSPKCLHGTRPWPQVADPARAGRPLHRRRIALRFAHPQNHARIIGVFVYPVCTFFVQNNTSFVYFAGFRPS